MSVFHEALGHKFRVHAWPMLSLIPRVQVKKESDDARGAEV